MANLPMSRFADAADSAPTPVRPILNYIWIAKDGTKEGRVIPGHYLANVVRLASAHPSHDVLLWADETLLTPEEWDDLQAALMPLPNARLRSLNEIYDYAEDELFRKFHWRPIDQTTPIAQKSDYARMIVLNHLFLTTDADTVLYSDVDIVDPQLDSERVAAILDEHGFVGAKCNLNGRHKTWFLENQFFGLRRREFPFLNEALMPVTRLAIAEGINGWRPYCRLVGERFGEADPSLDHICIRTTELPKPEALKRTTTIWAADKPVVSG